jgi:hypothetical protein
VVALPYVNILNRFSKHTQISNFMQILPVGAESFEAGGRTGGRADRRTDRQTDMEKLIVAFRNFANVSKKSERVVHENLPVISS